MDSCFVLLGTHQHCIAKIKNNGLHKLARKCATYLSANIICSEKRTVFGLVTRLDRSRASEHIRANDDYIKFVLWTHLRQAQAHIAHHVQFNAQFAKRQGVTIAVIVLDWKSNRKQRSEGLKEWSKKWSKEGTKPGRIDWISHPCLQLEFSKLKICK